MSDMLQLVVAQPTEITSFSEHLIFGARLAASRQAEAYRTKLPYSINMTFPDNNDFALQLFCDCADPWLVGNQRTILL